jgi:hypothetical protein
MKGQAEILAEQNLRQSNIEIGGVSCTRYHQCTGQNENVKKAHNNQAFD